MYIYVTKYIYMYYHLLSIKCLSILPTVPKRLLDLYLGLVFGLQTPSKMVFGALG